MAHDSYKPTNPIVLNARESKWSRNDNILWKLLACLLILIIAILVVLIIMITSRLTPTCYRKSPVETQVTTPSIFDSLTRQELEQARDYMLKWSGLQLVEMEKALPSNAYIYLIDLHLPNKSDALQYLDENKPRPQRIAKAFVARGDLTPPVLEEYLVTLTGIMTHQLFKNPSYSRDPIPHSSRPFDQVGMSRINELYSYSLKRLERILVESYGAKYHNCTKGKEHCLTVIDVAPRGRSSSERQSWVFLLRDVHGYYLHPVGFQFLLFHEGTDTSKWRILKFYYNNRLFDSEDALLKAYDSGTVDKIKVPFPKEPENDLYSSMNLRGQPSGEPLRPPRLVYPDGERYTIRGQHVTYLNWDFDFRMDPSTGIRLFDVRYRGERILYEFGNVDLLVFYSGHNPMQGLVNFYDAAWLLGVNAFELARGVDCPEAATYFDYHFLFNSNNVRINRNSMCIFEHDNGIPLGRHYSSDFVNGKGYRNYAGINDYALILRYIPVVWNYDYVIDFVFHQDGVVQVKVAPTGYLQATFHSPYEEKYGHKIQENVVAPMHHHAFQFKADVDVGGRANRFATLDIKLETSPYPWSDDPQEKVQKYFVKTDYSTEKAAALKYNFETPKYYLVYSNTSKNSLGYNRGVRVKLSGMSKLLMPMDKGPHNPANGAALSQYQIAVTKHKDSESSSTGIYSQNDPYNPVVDFAKYIVDDEGILDEDLVIWASLGVHHIPSVEDVPVTTTSSNQASLYIVPYNLHDVNPMIYSRDLVSVKPNEDLSETEVERNGVPEGVKCAPPDMKFTYNGTNFL